MKYQYPYVGNMTEYGWPIFRSIQDCPYGLLPHILDARRESVEYLYRQADASESGGFYSNARYWREQARIYYLDAYRMGVELGFSEEDEDLEEEIHGLVAEWEGTTIAR